MNPVNPYGDIDLTSYLQTEGRRRAAELARTSSASATGTVSQPATQSTQGHTDQQGATGQTPTPNQEQHSRAARQAGSLTEVLQQMGVTGSGRRAGR